MAGRHRKPVDHKVAKGTAVGVTTAALLAVPSSAGALPAGNVDEALDLIADCESDGRNVPNFINDATHTAFGPWQITNTTWRLYGGTDFAPNARFATIDEQRIVAKRILAARPNGADWDESKHCWGSRFAAALSGQNVTDIHPTGGPGSEAISGGRTGAPAASPAPAPAPPQADTGGLTYTVRSGDVLTRIAASTGHPIQHLVDWNNLSDPDFLLVGQVLRLTPPEQAPAPAPAPESGGTVTVQPGDELRHLAAEYGVSTNDLYQANRDVIEDPDLIFPGEVLTLPGGSAEPEVEVDLHEHDRMDPTPGAHGLSIGMNQWDPGIRGSITESADRFGIETVYTRAGHQPSRERAADFMTYGDVGTQQAQLQFLLDNRDRLGIEYVISRQRIYGAWTGWRGQFMPDRGSPTANHMDHNHVAYRAGFTYAGAAPAPAPAPSGPDATTYTVQRGDTLGRIATTQGVDGGWRTIYDANQSVIGPNPDRIQVGMSLVLVDSDGTRNLFGATPRIS